MDPASILALVGGLVTVVENIIATRNEDATAALADLKAQIAKMQAALEQGGAVDQAFATDDAKLQAAIDAASKAVP